MSISQIPSGWTITRSDERIVVQHVSGSFYAAAKEGDSGIAESILYMLADSLLSATLSPAHIEDGEEVEVVAKRWRVIDPPQNNPYCWHLDFRVPVEDGVEVQPLMTVAQHQRIVAALQSEVSRLKVMADNYFAIATDRHLEIVSLKAEVALSAPPATDPWTPSGADYDRNIHHNPDAKAWADLFVATFPGLADKHGLMIGWFANAMMAMHDWLKSKEEAAPPAAGVPEGLADALLREIAARNEVLEALFNEFCRGGTPNWDHLFERARQLFVYAMPEPAHSFALGKAAPTPPAAGTTSDQYRAELYDEVWQKARDMGYGNVTDALVELERMKATPPAAGVPDGWKLIPAQPNEAMLNQISPISGKEERLPYWWHQALIKFAPTPPASEQQRAVGLDVIDKLRIELRPEYEAGYTAVAYVDSDQPVAWADGMTAREAIAELLRLNPHLAKGEGV